MDPLSITASAVGLAVNILRSAASVKDAVDQFRDAPAVARDIEHEITIVQASLRQVEAALQRDAQAIWRLRLDDIFDLSVEGCRDTLQQIDQEFKSLFGRHDWRLRLAVWWNAGEMGRLLGRLETKKGSLMLLVQALSLHSVQEMQELLQQNMRTLDIARSGLDHMVPSYPAYTPKELDSRASVIGSEDSVLGGRDSVISNTRFVFDDICFDSKPYRHAVARASAKKPKQQRRKAVAAPPDLPLLPALEETEAEAESKLPGEAPAPTSPMGVTAEEHEAVVMKLREAEALIQALQGRVRVKKRRKASRPMKGLQTNPLPEKETVQDGPKQAAQLDGKASNATDQPSAVPDRAFATAKSSPSADHPQESFLSDDFTSGEQVKNLEARRLVRVQVTPGKHKALHAIIVDNSKTSHRRKPKQKRLASSTSAPDMQPEPAPTTTDTATENTISSTPPCFFPDGGDTEEGPSPIHETSEQRKGAALAATKAAMTAEARPSFADRYANAVNDAIKKLVLPELEAMKLKNERSRAKIEDTHIPDDVARQIFDSFHINGGRPLAGIKKSTDEVKHHARNELPKRGARPPSPLLPRAETKEETPKQRSILRRAREVLDTGSSHDLAAVEEWLAQMLPEIDVVKAQGRRGGEDGVACA
ncbi:hypothetical protein C8A00DRAFT_37263 [Chaetomidium leptoderma]|uniref:Fungal N-terminal domain-containing protein n=1 Tax=Chaetomidium leptoderma TaxID=669021 RepID=A0AAN6ZU35_9PEZI|nr:hypothetical protein C8A00DRAFT_37263 [Chaetomidium leptoderma]